MKLLKYIEDRLLSKNQKLRKRFASRAIIFDENGKIPIEFVSKLNFHKLPGGGIEKGEDEITACKREMSEETGCEMSITGELGQVEEYRSRYNLYQTSYCFLGKVTKKGSPHLEKGEIKDGHQLVWFTLEEALRVFKKDNSDDYESKFIKQRDLTFLEEAKKLYHPRDF